MHESVGIVVNLINPCVRNNVTRPMSRPIRPSLHVIYLPVRAREDALANVKLENAHSMPLNSSMKLKTEVEL